MAPVPTTFKALEKGTAVPALEMNAVGTDPVVSTIRVFPEAVVVTPEAPKTFKTPEAGVAVPVLAV
jgi:hypothetical protein